MRLDQRLVDAAIELLKRRYPTGEGVAAAGYTARGDLLTSVDFGAFCDAGNLCAETGVILEANKLGTSLTAIACVSRASEAAPILILGACGICQERLVGSGFDVEIAVPTEADPTRWEMRTLQQMQPFHFSRAYRPAHLR